MQKERTLENLTRLDKRTYIYIGSRETWDVFLKKAMEEGFKKPCEEWEDYLAVNKDKTFNFIGFIGRMKVHSKQDDFCLVDLDLYLNGAENYILNGK